MLRLVSLLLLIFTGFGQSLSAQTADAQAAWEVAYAARVDGPSDIPLGEQGVLHLPDNMFYIPAAQSVPLMASWGNSTGPGFMGLLADKSDSEPWIVTMNFTREGHVADDDAADWDKAALLQSLKEGTEAQNLENAKRGIPGLLVNGWLEEPSYDKATHRLIWSMSATVEGAEPGSPNTVNYNTYMLGREGFFAFNLVTTDATIAKDKLAAQTILASAEYKPGKRYEDYVAGVDPVAAYGIAALVGGLAAKKLGLLALAGVFVLKFIKIFAIAGIAAVVGLGKVLSRRKGGSV